MYNGYTKTIPALTQIDNEIEYCKTHNASGFYNARLAELEQKRLLETITIEAQDIYFEPLSEQEQQAAEIASYDFLVDSAYGTANLTDPRTPEQKSLDEMWREEQDTREAVRP